MKYTILINQLTWQIYLPEADFRHAIVLEIIKSLCNSQNDKIVRSNDGYTWISNAMIIKEAPMLQYNSKSSLTPIFKKLNEWGLISIRIDETTNNHFYKLTEKAEMLDRKMDLDESNEHPFKILNGGVQNNERPRSKKRTYKTTNYKTTIDKDSDSPKEGESLPQKSKVKEFQDDWVSEYPGNYIVTDHKKWGGQVKGLIQSLERVFNSHGYEKLVECRKRYFKSKRKWHVDSKYSFDVFMSDINSFVNQKTEKSAYQRNLEELGVSDDGK